MENSYENAVKLAKEGDFKRSREILEKIVVHQKDNHQIWNNLGVVEQNLNNLEKALEYYQKAIRHNPEFWEAYYNQSLAYMKTGKLEEAERILGIYLAKNSRDSIAWNNYGIIQSQLGDINLAMDAMDKAVQYDDANYLAYYNKGKLFMEQEDYEKSIECFNKTQSLINILADNDILPYVKDTLYAATMLKAEALGLINAIPEGKMEYKKASEIKNTEPEALLRLGMLEADGKKYAEALELFKKAVERKPDLPDGWIELGYLYTQPEMEDHPEAIRCFRKSLEMDPYNLSVWNEVISICEKFGKEKDMEEAYKKMIQLFPDNDEVLNDAGAFFIQNREEYAEELLKRAMEINKDLTEPYINMGILYKNKASGSHNMEEKRMFAMQSLEYFNQALDMEPDDSWVMTKKEELIRQNERIFL